MLPSELADDLCSLRPHEDRLAVTVEIPFGAIWRRAPRRSTAQIRSDARLTYGEAERTLSGTETVERRSRGDAPAGGSDRERATAQALFARGALRIEAAEVTFAFDASGGVADAWLEHEPYAHMLVES